MNKVSRWFLFPHFYCYRTSSLGVWDRAELLYARVVVYASKQLNDTGRLWL